MVTRSGVLLCPVRCAVFVCVFVCACVRLNFLSVALPQQPHIRHYLTMRTQPGANPLSVCLFVCLFVCLSVCCVLLLSLMPLQSVNLMCLSDFTTDLHSYTLSHTQTCTNLHTHRHAELKQKRIHPNVCLCAEHYNTKIPVGQPLCRATSGSLWFGDNVSRSHQKNHSLPAQHYVHVNTLYCCDAMQTPIKTECLRPKLIWIVNPN